VDRRQYAPEKVTADGNLSELEGTGAGVADFRITGQRLR
jgi:hypothetical protein